MDMYMSLTLHVQNNAFLLVYFSPILSSDGKWLMSPPLLFVFSISLIIFEQHYIMRHCINGRILNNILFLFAVFTTTPVPASIHLFQCIFITIYSTPCFCTQNFTKPILFCFVFSVINLRRI